MAIGFTGRAITFTAVNEGVELTHAVEIVGITFQGTGLTISQRVVVRNHKTPGSGSALVDYLTEGAADNGDLWGGRQPQIVTGLSIDNNTIAGTWVLTVFVR
jgi:hypothetical protein